MKVRKKTVPLTANNLTKGVKNYIKVKGGFAVRVNTMGVYDPSLKLFRKIAKDDKGVSDVVACYNGRAVFVEIKIGSDKESKDQLRFKKNMTEAGAACFVARDMDSFIEEFEEEFNL